MPALWRWADNYSYVIGAVLIVVGSGLIQFGGKHYLASIVTINTFGMMFLILFSLFGIVMPFSTPQFIVWVCVFMSLFIGLGLGIGAYQWPKFGIISIGMFAGGLLGLLFYTVCFSNFGHQSEEAQKEVKQGQISIHYIDQKQAPQTLKDSEYSQLQNCILLGIIMFSGLMLMFFDYAVIYCACITGSYLAVRGLSIFIGGFPNEFIVYDSMINQRFMQNQQSLFMYMILMIVVASVSVQNQLRMRRENIEIYSYKRYDFRYRRALQNNYGPLAADDEEREGVDEKSESS